VFGHLAMTKSILALSVALVAFSVYLPVRHGEFVFDDRKLIVENTELLRPAGSFSSEISHVAKRMFGIFEAEIDDEVRHSFRPIRFASLRFDVLLTRALQEEPESQALSPIVFHLHNAVLHGLNALLVAVLVSLLIPRGPIWLPATIAFAFALHPIQTESVAYISGRRDVLFLFFYLIALVLYTSARRNGSWGIGFLLAVVTWLALGAKEMSATLPVSMLLLEGIADRQPGDRIGLKRVLDRVPLWIPSFLTVIVFATYLLLRQNPGGGSEWWGGTPLAAACTSSRAVFYYIRLLLVPYPLSVDYSFDAFSSSSGLLSPWTGAASLIVSLSILIFAWKRRVSSPELSASIALFYVTLSPVSQLIPHPERFAEHHIYLPILPWLAVCTLLLKPLFQRSPERCFAGLGVLFLIYGGLTSGRLDSWSGPYNLWKSAAETHPRCARAHFGWGNAAQTAGRSAEAVRALGMAISILEPIDRDSLQHGYYLQALQIRAGVLSSSSLEADLSMARDHLNTLLDSVDTDGSPVAKEPRIWLDLLKVEERLGNRQRALDAARQIQRLDANSSITLEARLFEAAVLASEENVGDSQELLLAAMQNASSDRQKARVWYQIGVLHAEQDEWSEALIAFDRSAAVIDTAGRRTSALYKSAEALMHLGKPREARDRLEEVLQDDATHLPALLSLGEIVMGSGELEQAIRVFETVLSVVPNDQRARRGLRQARARLRMRGDQTVPAVDPTRVTALIMLADRKEAEGELFDAIQALVKAERQCEGPSERERRIALHLRIARLHVRASLKASRESENDSSVVIAQLELALDRYQKIRDQADPSQRIDAAIEAADLTRRLFGSKGAYSLLLEEYEAGVVGVKMLLVLGGMAEMIPDHDSALSWYRLVLGTPDASEGEQESARQSIRRLESTRR